MRAGAKPWGSTSGDARRAGEFCSGTRTAGDRRPGPGGAPSNQGAAYSSRSAPAARGAAGAPSLEGARRRRQAESRRSPRGSLFHGGAPGGGTPTGAALPDENPRGPREPRRRRRGGAKRARSPHECSPFPTPATEDSPMVQATFTRQKRELAKAAGWIERLRAPRDPATSPSTPKGRRSPRPARDLRRLRPRGGRPQGAGDRRRGGAAARRPAARQRQEHGALLPFRGVEADLKSVPQLRALEGGARHPRRPRPEAPAAEPQDRPQHHRRRPARVRRQDEGRVRGSGALQTLRGGRPPPACAPTRSTTARRSAPTSRCRWTTASRSRVTQALEEMVTDLGTAVQVAIDEANGRGHEDDQRNNAA